MQDFASFFEIFPGGGPPEPPPPLEGHRRTRLIVLSRDLQRVGRRGLTTLSDLLSLREIAQGRGEWEDLCKDVCKSNRCVYD